MGYFAGVKLHDVVVEGVNDFKYELRTLEGGFDKEESEFFDHND